MRRQQGRVESWRAKAKFLATFGSVELQLLLIRIIRWNYDRTSGGDFLLSSKCQHSRENEKYIKQ